jgi:hypothetical protein
MKLTAAKDILDRAGSKPTERIEASAQTSSVDD